MTTGPFAYCDEHIFVHETNSSPTVQTYSVSTIFGVSITNTSDEIAELFVDFREWSFGTASVTNAAVEYAVFSSYAGFRDTRDVSSDPVTCTAGESDDLLNDVTLLPGATYERAFSEEIHAELKGRAVPESATLPLFAAGLGLLGWFGWWRKRSAAPA